MNKINGKTTYRVRSGFERAAGFGSLPLKGSLKGGGQEGGVATGTGAGGGPRRASSGVAPAKRAARCTDPLLSSPFQGEGPEPARAATFTGVAGAAILLL